MGRCCGILNKDKVLSSLQLDKISELLTVFMRRSHWGELFVFEINLGVRKLCFHWNHLLVSPWEMLGFLAGPAL